MDTSTPEAPLYNVVHHGKTAQSPSISHCSGCAAKQHASGCAATNLYILDRFQQVVVHAPPWWWRKPTAREPNARWFSDGWSEFLQSIVRKRVCWILRPSAEAQDEFGVAPDLGPFR